jgi:hypothetical protein
LFRPLRYTALSGTCFHPINAHFAAEKCQAIEFGPHAHADFAQNAKGKLVRHLHLECRCVRHARIPVAIRSVPHFRTCGTDPVTKRHCPFTSPRNRRAMLASRAQPETPGKVEQVGFHPEGMADLITIELLSAGRQHPAPAAYSDDLSGRPPALVWPFPTCETPAPAVGVVSTLGKGNGFASAISSAVQGRACFGSPAELTLPGLPGRWVAVLCLPIFTHTIPYTTTCCISDRALLPK